MYVGNLPWSVTDESLSALFSKHGATSRAKVVMDRDTGRSRGFAFVTMDNDGEAQAAITALNGSQVDGRALTVRRAEPRAQGGGMGGGAGGGGGQGGGQRRTGGGGGGGGYGGGQGGGGYGRRDG